MIISDQLSEEFLRPFTFSSGFENPQSVNPDVGIGSNNLFNLFLRIDVSKSVVEVPTVARINTEYILDNKIKYQSYKEFSDLVIPLFETDTPYIRRAASAIFRVFRQTKLSDRLLKVVTNKDEVYYGNRGLILDKDFNILFITILEASLDEEERKVIHNKARVYIHPKVFGHEGVLEKGIVKTLIPAFTTKGVLVKETSRAHSNINYYTKEETLKGIVRTLVRPLAEIVIADVSEKFLAKPVKPNPVTFNKETVNDFLLAHINEIVL